VGNTNHQAQIKNTLAWAPIKQLPCTERKKNPIHRAPIKSTHAWDNYFAKGKPYAKKVKCLSRYHIHYAFLISGLLISTFLTSGLLKSAINLLPSVKNPHNPL
jgi:hypothetical protein